MELLPLLDGYEDTDRQANNSQHLIHAYQRELTEQVIEPHMSWFAAQYPDPLSTNVDTRPQIEIRSPHEAESSSNRS
jgi:hypothetical protein